MQLTLWSASRAEAKERGLTRYFTGKPCKRGHVAERTTRNGHCGLCQRVHANDWGRINRAAELVRKREWARNNPLANRRWAETNVSRRRELGRAASHRRRARERAALGYVSPNIEGRLMRSQGGQCAGRGCGVYLIADPRNFHLDHIIPLSRGGPHDDTNLQLLCAPCNLSKGSQLPSS